jgi:hypothetical protein
MHTLIWSIVIFCIGVLVGLVLGGVFRSLPPCERCIWNPDADAQEVDDDPFEP